MAKRSANDGTTDRETHEQTGGSGRILEEYLSELKANRATGAGVPEISYYSALANLFNVTGFGNLEGDSASILDNWLVAAPNWLGPTTIYVAVAADLDRDGIYNDAPDLIVDANGDGKIDETDLRSFGVASRVVVSRFHVNP